MKQTLLGCLIALSFAACQKKIDEPAPVVPVVPEKITITNPGFESGLTGWKIETAYTGIYGFHQDSAAKFGGSYGLSFYAAQPYHYPGNPQETPWNGRIYQTVTGLKNGNYKLKLLGLAQGTGMYVYANGASAADTKLAFRTDQVERYELDFTVTGGTAKFGFVCIDAGGTQPFAPYFFVDEVELWTR